MHIEPGYIIAAKVAVANGVAVSMVAYYARFLVTNPTNIIKTLLAALFFSLFMQSVHMPVGPSELHFIGASAMYFLLGFVPTVLGFSLGLLLQGLVFEPTDLVHLGVNSLSLMIPLVTVHFALGKHFFEQKTKLSWANIVKFDAMYYAGVTSMVGFWLLVSQVETPFMAWLTFTASYISIVAFEPVFTYFTVKAMKKYEERSVISQFFAVKALKFK